MFSMAMGNMFYAQGYYHGVGLAANYGIYDGGVAAVPGVLYKASYAISENGPSFAVSAYPYLGFNLNSREGGSLGFELPVLGEAYFGDLDDRCFFAGLGFSYAFIAESGSSTEFADGTTYSSGSIGGPVMGPQIGLGGQFNLKDRLLGIRVSYTYGINKLDGGSKPMMIGTGLFLVLGQ